MAPSTVSPEALAEWRLDRNLRQVDLAEALGVNVMTVSRWETGHRPIPPFLGLALQALDEQYPVVEVQR